MKQAGLEDEVIHATASHGYGTVSYTHLPRGRYIIEVCNNAPCYISKSHVMAKFLRKELGINFGETTPDGMFSLQYMPCVGAVSYTHLD